MAISETDLGAVVRQVTPKRSKMKLIQDKIKKFGKEHKNQSHVQKESTQNASSLLESPKFSRSELTDYSQKASQRSSSQINQRNNLEGAINKI